jgi:hypothetical protein
MTSREDTFDDASFGSWSIPGYEFFGINANGDPRLRKGEVLRTIGTVASIGCAVAVTLAVESAKDAGKALIERAKK